MSRRSIAMAIVTALMMTTIALPALATKPFHVSASQSENRFNPCTGEPHVVTMNWDLKVISNNKTQVIVFDTTLSTSDGWVGEGRETAATNPNFLANTFSLRVTNDSDGLYMVKGRRLVDLDTGETQLSNLDVRCVRP